MLWRICLWAALGILLASVLWVLGPGRKRRGKQGGVRPLYILTIGTALAGILIHFPAFWTLSDGSLLGGVNALLLSLHTTVQLFVLCAGNLFMGQTMPPATELGQLYLVVTAVLYLLAPALTVSCILSFFQNTTAYLRYALCGRRQIYVFTALNRESLALAGDLLRQNPKGRMVFAGVREGELQDQAETLGAICFRKPTSSIRFGVRKHYETLTFLAMSREEEENLEQAIALMQSYRQWENTRLYVFASGLDSEIMLSQTDKGKMQVHRVDETRSLVYQLLDQEGERLFREAWQGEINVLLVGLGKIGSQLLRALSWYGQMDGYRLTIHAFDRDPEAEERFRNQCPELLDNIHNGTEIPGEARYTIRIHAGCTLGSAAFVRVLEQIPHPTYVMVALGSDEENIHSALELRSLCERQHKHPRIQAVAYRGDQQGYLSQLKNFRGTPYDIEFVGSREQIFTEKTILNWSLEREALERHLKWGKESDFWNYEYHYHSSMATALHRRARIACGIPGADKAENQLTSEEREVLEQLEHRRWNAYMRSEGYVYSGSRDKASRNDLARVHPDLVPFRELTQEDRRKDSAVATK